jgi:hypothetical protein
MRFRPLFAATLFGSSALLSALFALSCSSSTYPNPVLTFNSGQESDTFNDVDHYVIERVDANSNTKELLNTKKLPKTFDMGNTGTYAFVGTAYDSDGKVVAVGRTLMAAPGEILGAEVPMFFARTDRATRPNGSFANALKQNPVAAIYSYNYVWFFDDSSGNNIKTDAYSVAVWEQYSPPTQYSSIACAHVPCALKNVIVMGGVYVLVIGSDWALFIDTVQSLGVEFKLPTELTAWSDITGGRVLPGGDSSALFVGGTRPTNPTKAILGFSKVGNYSYLSTNTARAGAALLYEQDFGIVLVGGSSDGAGVERMAFGSSGLADSFSDVPYPADPVVGAALVMEDKTHLLRVGGKNTDGSKAPTVRIDMGCTQNCAYEPVPALDVELYNAQSYYDVVTGETLVAGENTTGLTEVYRYVSSGFVAIDFPDAQKRINALALELPNHQLAVIGGTDPQDSTASRTALSVVAF